MRTKTISTRLPPEILRRLELVAKVDRRSLSQVVGMLVETALPELEAEIEQRQGSLIASTDPRAEAVAVTAGKILHTLAADAPRKSRKRSPE